MDDRLTDQPGPTDIVKPVEHLFAEAKSKNAERRQAAFSEFFQMCDDMGELLHAAIPVFLKHLTDPDREIRGMADGGLRACVPASIEPLIDALSDEDSKVRSAASDALGSIGKKAMAATDALRGCLTDPVEDVRCRAAWALGLIGDTSQRTVSTLLAMAQAGDAKERSSALHALGNVGKSLPDPTLLRTHQSVILRAVQDRNEDVRGSAYHLLPALQLPAKDELELLISGLATATSSELRSRIAWRLRELVTEIDVTRHLASIMGAIRKGECDAKDLCEIVAELGPKALSAVPTLIDSLRSDDEYLVLAAAKALWKIDRRADEILPALERLFDEIGESVCDVLSEIGPAAARFTDRLIAALEEEDWDLQWAAADALGAIATCEPEVIEALTAALGHDSPVVRSAAVCALARLGSPVVPALLQILQNDSDDRSEWAADALGRIGPAAVTAVPVLRGKMHSAGKALATWSAIALAKISGDAAAVPILIDLLQDPDRADLYGPAAEGLKAIGPAAAEAISALTAALDHEDERVRQAAAEALAAIKSQPH